MSASVRDAALTQFDLLATRTATLTPAALDLPTRLHPWRVRELIAHLTRNIGAIPPAIRRPSPRKRTVALPDYYDNAAEVAPAVSTRAVDEARTGVSWPHELATATAEARQSLAGQPDTRLVAVRLGDLTLEDFLVTRCVEGIVHGLVHGLVLAHALAADPTTWTTHPAAEVTATHLATRAARTGPTAKVTPAAVHIGPAVIPVLTYIDWAAARTAAPDPALTKIKPALL